jgi:formamidopyrimidine-DNA glycosylase
MPELPEVEITARRLHAALAGAQVESALAPGIVTMKTVDPPVGKLAGQQLSGVRRRGKLLILEFRELALVVHLMSAGRVQLFEKRASRRDRTARLVIRMSDGHELRLREFGTRQRAWAKLLPPDAVEHDEAIATLGPDAWPAPAGDVFSRLLAQPRHLHPLLRDQRVIAGIGRSWVDELLWTAQLSPFQQGSELEPGAAERLRVACDEVIGGAIAHYEQVVGEALPDRLPMPLKVHKRQGEPCPRCGTALEAVHFKEYVMTYCPTDQAGGRVFKDRRLSRLLK